MKQGVTNGKKKEREGDDEVFFRELVTTIIYFLAI
jgi:hypothetical protein